MRGMAPFPPGVFARLHRIRTVTVELDHAERVVKATRCKELTTRDDWRELCWILGSSAWPEAWLWDLREVRAFA